MTQTDLEKYLSQARLNGVYKRKLLEDTIRQVWEDARKVGYGQGLQDAKYERQSDAA